MTGGLCTLWLFNGVRSDENGEDRAGLVLDHATTYDADARMGGVAIRRGGGMCVRRRPQALRSVARAAACCRRTFIAVT